MEHLFDDDYILACNVPDLKIFPNNTVTVLFTISDSVQQQWWVRERVTGNCQNHGSKNKASSRTTKPGPQVRKDRGEKKQFQCESGRAMEQAFQRNQRSKKCSAVQKIAEKESK